MEESFLHFIWSFQHFNTRILNTDSGTGIVVINPGFKNTDAGPDFKNAKVKIGEIIWNGNVEIHIHSADWARHNHHIDDAYDNVILHVVWKNDAVVRRKDDTIIPVLELKNIVDEELILNYRQLFRPGNEILCEKFIDNVKPITLLSMMDKVLVERLEHKSEAIFREIALTGNDWEEITWRKLCQNFGFKTNAHPFLELGKSLPLNILKKQAHNLKSIEALLFGQAGFLEESVEDDYFEELVREYDFLKRKYDLNRRIDKHQWKFLRLRPANFPTIRIAQLAAIVANHSNLFSLFTDYDNISDLKKALGTRQSAYWIKHYNFCSESKTELGRLGISSIENILINTAAPILFANGIHKDNEADKEKALMVLSSVKAESNRITKNWKSLGISMKSAFDSQAAIELYNNYCLKKKCLHCNVGAEIISKK